MAGKNILVLDDSTFVPTINDGGLPVVVDFWATWCGPCKMVAPTFERLAAEFDGKARFAKVDVDQCQKTAGEFGVRVMPTFMIFKDGECTAKIEGAPAPQILKDRISGAIS